MFFKERLEPSGIQKTALALLSSALVEACAVPPPAPQEAPPIEATPSPVSSPDPKKERRQKTLDEILEKKGAWTSYPDITLRIRSATVSISPEETDLMTLVEINLQNSSLFFPADAATGTLTVVSANRTSAYLSGITHAIRRPATDSETPKQNLFIASFPPNATMDFEIMLTEGSFFEQLEKLEAGKAVQPRTNPAANSFSVKIENSNEVQKALEEHVASNSLSYMFHYRHENGSFEDKTPSRELLSADGGPNDAAQ